MYWTPPGPRAPLIRSKIFTDAGKTRRLGISAAFNGTRFAGSVPVGRDAGANAGDVASLLERLAAFIRGGGAR
jgi:hypothetical protein